MKSGYTITNQNFLSGSDILETVIVFNYIYLNEVYSHFVSFTPAKDLYGKGREVVGYWKVKQLKN